MLESQFPFSMIMIVCVYLVMNSLLKKYKCKCRLFYVDKRHSKLTKPNGPAALPTNDATASNSNQDSKSDDAKSKSKSGKQGDKSEKGEKESKEDNMKGEEEKRNRILETSHVQVPAVSRKKIRGRV